MAKNSCSRSRRSVTSSSTANPGAEQGGADLTRVVAVNPQIGAALVCRDFNLRTNGCQRLPRGAQVDTRARVVPSLKLSSDIGICASNRPLLITTMSSAVASISLSR